MHPASCGGNTLHLLDCFRPAEAAGAHRPGPRAPSRWPPSSKDIINVPKEYLSELFPRRDARQDAVISEHDLVGSVREFQMKASAFTFNDTPPKMTIQGRARYPGIPGRRKDAAPDR